MAGFLRKLFGGAASTADSPVDRYGERDRNPVVAASVTGAAETGPKVWAPAIGYDRAEADQSLLSRDPVGPNPGDRVQSLTRPATERGAEP